MQFNSYIFILCFLPLTMLAYFGLNRLEKYNAAKLSLVVASLVFCGYTDISYVYILVFSILMNYMICLLMRLCPQGCRLLVGIGIIANVALLGYFKYFDFLLENINALTGSNFNYLKLALPLGISYFTFQQIAYLVDAGRGACAEHSLVDYVLYVTFFPRFVSGPIVPQDELLPQFASVENKHLNAENIVKGLQLLDCPSLCGQYKKRSCIGIFSLSGVAQR